jgi:hypothetical protein
VPAPVSVRISTYVQFSVPIHVVFERSFTSRTRREKANCGSVGVFVSEVVESVVQGLNPREEEDGCLPAD